MGVRQVRIAFLFLFRLEIVPVNFCASATLVN